MKIAILEDSWCVKVIGYLACFYGHEVLTIQASREYEGYLSAENPDTFSLQQYPGDEDFKKECLKKHFTCGNPKVILRTIIEFQPELILLDHFLNIRLDGDWFAKEIRLELPNITVVSISSVDVPYANTSISGKDRMAIDEYGYKNFCDAFQKMQTSKFP